ncbi:hypothetical protein JCM6882_004977 [Rhodosporidiobolus microsporus]
MPSTPSTPSHSVSPSPSSTFSLNSPTSPSPPPLPCDSRPGKGLRAGDPRPPGPAFSRHLHSLSRCNASLLSRLRLDFCDLGGTKRMLADDDPQRLCECGEVETRVHYLLECERYAEERRALAAAVKKGGGGSLSLVSLFLPRFTSPLLRFIHSTNRFPRLFDQGDPHPARSAS